MMGIELFYRFVRQIVEHSQVPHSSSVVIEKNSNGTSMDLWVHNFAKNVDVWKDCELHPTSIILFKVNGLSSHRFYFGNSVTDNPGQV